MGWEYLLSHFTLFIWPFSPKSCRCLYLQSHGSIMGYQLVNAQISNEPSTVAPKLSRKKVPSRDETDRFFIWRFFLRRYPIRIPNHRAPNHQFTIDKEYLLGGGNWKIFFSPLKWGRWTHFDEHTVQLCWNSQLVLFSPFFFSCDAWNKENIIPKLPRLGTPRSSTLVPLRNKNQRPIGSMGRLDTCTYTFSLSFMVINKCI